MEQSPRRNLLTGPTEAFGRNDPQFRLNKVAEAILGDGSTIKLLQDPASWTGGYSRVPGGSERVVRVGTVPVPDATARQWNIEGTTKEEQLVFKLAHELAHAFSEQRGYEAALTRWLDGEDQMQIEARCIPYIELYAFLALHGRVSGLSTSDFYRAQTAETGSGRLEMPVLEDVTEIIAAYFLGDEYFSEKLTKSHTLLTPEQVEYIRTRVIQICAEFDR